MRRKIVGVMMLKNERYFIERVLAGALPMLDRLIVIDTGSTDGTPAVISRYLTAYGFHRFEIHRDVPLLSTHDYVQEFCGSPTWVFGIDGDEIYHSVRLMALRSAILTGAFDEYYQIKGMYLHADSWEQSETSEIASGWFGPPSHNPTKLYNFEQFTEWPNDGKRTLFHAKTRKIKLGAQLYRSSGDWRRTDLRCIHVRFLPRSTESRFDLGLRLTPEDLIGRGSRKDRGRRDDANERLQYRKGDYHHVDANTFEEVEYGILD